MFEGLNFALLEGGVAKSEYPCLVNMIVSLVVVVSVDMFFYYLHCKLTHLTLHYPLPSSLTGKTDRHPGNIQWRLVVKKKKDEYMSSIRARKPIIVMEAR